MEPNLYEPKFIRELPEFDIGELGFGRVYAGCPNRGIKSVGKRCFEKDYRWRNLTRDVPTSRILEAPRKLKGVLFLVTIPLDVVLLV